MKLSTTITVNETVLETIYPPLNIGKIDKFLKEHLGEGNYELPNKFNVEKFTPDVKKLLEDVYVNKNLKVRAAIKARFMQYMEFSSHFLDYTPIKKIEDGGEFELTHLLRNKKLNKNAGVFIVSIMNKKELNQIIKNLNDSHLVDDNGSKIKLDEIFLVCGRLERTFAKNLDYIELDSHKMKLSFIVEYLDTNRPFEDDDILIINDDDFRIQGFNFGALEDVLSVIKKKLGRGKYIVWKEEHTGKRKQIWEGIIYPKELLKRK
jgi:hypothetical protein